MNNTDEDIIDETISLFRANCFFRNFEIKGPADRVLIYLTLFLQECLGKLSNNPSFNEAQKILLTHALQSFPLPGEPQFPLNAMYEKPSSRMNTGTHTLKSILDALKNYLVQLKQEFVNRFLNKIRLHLINISFNFLL